MQDFRKKLQQIDPLMLARKAQVDREALILADIRRLKEQVSHELTAKQDSYLKGVDKANDQRMSKTCETRDVVESSVDYAKMQWHQSYKRFKKLEDQEKKQLGRLMEAEINLKSIEKLKGKYQEKLFEQIKIHEQKELDAIALQKHFLRE